jgi:ABC-2 type transport system permease protein
MNTYSWLIRREFWENRAIWIVPAAVGAALTLATLFGRIDMSSLPLPVAHRDIGGLVLFTFGVVFFLVMSIYSSWYLLDCLYADRKDRSVLFWKSLPISDTATVLVKLFTGLIAIPLVYFIAADISTLLLAFIISIRARNALGGQLWQGDVWLQLQVMWLYLIVTTAIWYLPFAGWLMAVSAWARRAVMLWSILPPLALYLLERWFFGTHVFASVITDRLLGYIPVAFHVSSHHAAPATVDEALSASSSVWRLLNPIGFLTDPATWVGVIVGIAFIWGAIQLRLRRTEI